MRTLVEFSALHFVTLKAGLVDGLAGRQSVCREVRHRVVAVAAGKVVGLVSRAMPENPLPTLMAGETLCVLLCNRRLALVRETDDCR